MGIRCRREADSFSAAPLEHPLFTRPREFRGLSVPEVLLSGDHAEIARWRESESERVTRERRPDLLAVQWSEAMRQFSELDPKERSDVPDFRAGDTVRVHVRIVEGDKERVQVFEGVVLQRRRAGASSSFVVRKMSYGVGVERVFPLHSPTIAKIELKARGRVRRARLTYLRDLSGKAARIASASTSAAVAAAAGDATAKEETPPEA